MEEKRKRRWIKPLLLFLFAASVCGGYFAAKEYICNIESVGSSMEPTLMGREWAIGLQAEHIDEIQRGDILVFDPPFADAGRLYVKRVIGLPGESILIKDGAVYVDGFLLEEPYINEEWGTGAEPYEFQVPEGHYLMLGDNRDASWDARYWDDPYVGKSAIKAKAYAVYWPFKVMRYLY